MLSEAILLMGVSLLVLLMGPKSPIAIAVEIVVMILCLPAIRLVFRRAPPFVPTLMSDVRTMIDFAGIKKGDKVYDLGCGDGRLLLAAADKGATAIGYELSAPTLLLAKFRTYGRENIHALYGDFWKKDLGDADVVFSYLLLGAMAEFEKKIWPTLKPGCRVVSHAFSMPTIKPVKREGRVILYVKN